MTTAGDLVSTVSQELHGWGQSQDRITSLTSSILPGDLSFVVDAVFGPSSGIMAGLVEIDNELIFVTNVDKTSKVCTVAPFGRGFLGTTATTHSAGAGITSRPKVPRAPILKAINNVVGGVFPALFAVQKKDGSDGSMLLSYPSNSYTLSPTPVSIIDVQYKDYLGRWLPVRGYQLDRFDQSLRVAQYWPLGQPLRVIYRTEPTQFTSESDNYSVCGLPVTAQDVLTKGAAAALILGVDIARANSTTVESSNRSQVVPPGAGQTAGKYLLAEYLDRLKNETDALNTLYPPRLVKRFAP